MKIDTERATELSRDKMHSAIKQCSNLTDSNVVKASEDLDKKVLEEMLAQDPKIENSYLKRVQLQQNEQIRKLQSELDKTNERLRLAKEVVRLYQQGIDVQKALTVITAQAVREGII